MSMKFICILPLLIIISGCGVTGYYGSSEIKASKEGAVAKLEAQKFIGKRKEDVRGRYGEPRLIHYNIGTHNGHLGRPNEYTTYDEMWYYKYEAGVPLLFPDQYSIKFYFIGDSVVHVTG